MGVDGFASHENKFKENLLLAQTVLYAGARANQRTILAGQLIVLRTTLKGLLFGFKCSANKSLFHAFLVESLKVLRQVHLCLSNLYKDCYILTSAQNLAHKAELLENENYVQESAVTEALINYALQAGDFVSLLLEQSNEKSGASASQTQLQSLQELIARSFPHIPPEKEEALTEFFLTLARALRAELLAVGLGEHQNPSEPFLLLYTITMHDYERALKVLAVSGVHLISTVCTDSLNCCLSFDGKAQDFPITTQMVQNVVIFLEELEIVAAQLTKALFGAGQIIASSPLNDDSRRSVLAQRANLVAEFVNIHSSRMKSLLLWLNRDVTISLPELREEAVKLLSERPEMAVKFSWLSKNFIPGESDKNTWPW